jgi:hypothetical protein
MKQMQWSDQLIRLTLSVASLTINSATSTEYGNSLGMVLSPCAEAAVTNTGVHESSNTDSSEATERPFRRQRLCDGKGPPIVHEGTTLSSWRHDFDIPSTQEQMHLNPERSPEAKRRGLDGLSASSSVSQDAELPTQGDPMSQVLCRETAPDVIMPRSLLRSSEREHGLGNGGGRVSGIGIGRRSFFTDSIVDDASPLASDFVSQVASQSCFEETYSHCEITVFHQASTIKMASPSLHAESTAPSFPIHQEPFDNHASGLTRAEAVEDGFSGDSYFPAGVQQAKPPDRRISAPVSLDTSAQLDTQER